uniref:Uncharacterized protein n=1 Tax=Anguilla anguilla TaxID=7936 RepID=A0A0E9XWT6_ANGAN
MQMRGGKKTPRDPICIPHGCLPSIRRKYFDAVGRFAFNL